MKHAKPETPPLSHAGGKMADAIVAAAEFKPTVDGKRMVRHYEVHGMSVTELVAIDGPTEARKESK